MDIKSIKIGDILYDVYRTWDGITGGEVVKIDGKDNMVDLEATEGNVKTTYRIRPENLSRELPTQQPVSSSLQSATKQELLAELWERLKAEEAAADNVGPYTDIPHDQGQEPIYGHFHGSF